MKKSIIIFGLLVCFSSLVAQNLTTFHVTFGGNNLENAIVTVGGQSDTTDAQGIAEFLLPDGDSMYTVTKSGFAVVEDSITVAGAPVQVEVEMEVCWEVIILLSFEGGTPPDSAIVTLGNNSIWTYNGIAVFCVPNGSYSIYAGAEGYISYGGGQITVSNTSLNIVIQMYPILYDVTFFVNCCGEPIGNYSITYQGQTLITNTGGIVIFNLPAGFYSFVIGPFPISFTVPDTNYIEVDVCSEVTFHVTDDEGSPLEGVLIEVDNINLFTDINGEADTCLPIGTHQYLATKYNYGTQVGTFNVDTISQTIEIVMPLITFSVQFNIIGSCPNGFNGWYISINGELYEPGEVIYLPSGSFSYKTGYLNCWVSPTSMINVNGNLVINILSYSPHATFHISSSLGGNLQGAIVEVDTFSLVTNYSGNASFCLPGGDFNYSVTNEGYGTFSGIFSYVNYCQDTIVEILMDPVLVNENDMSEFRLYPNPSNGMFYLENLNSTCYITEITIKDITGRIVFHKNSVTNDKVEIDLKSQSKGMYFIRARSGDNSLNKILVIQ